MSEDSEDTARTAPGPARPNEYRAADFIEEYSDDDGYASEEVLHRLAVRKPDKKDYIRVHPRFAMTVRLFERTDPDNASRSESYLVHPSMKSHFEPGLLRQYRLHLAVTRKSSTPFVLPAKLPTDADRSWRSWYDTLLEAIELAKTRWVRIIPDPGSSSYKTRLANKSLEEPKRPDLSEDDVIRLAFNGRIVDSPEHVVIRELLGEE